MLYEIGGVNAAWISLIGLAISFGLTALLTAKLARFLPKDQGRAYAHEGSLSGGKPRGAGIIFVLVFTAVMLLFSRINAQSAIYLLLIVIEMLTGFLDDAAKKPWGEYLKGFLDLCVSAAVAGTFLYFNGSTIYLALFGVTFTIPPVLFVILAVILVWASINVVNCSDGVDSLSATMVIICLLSFYVLDRLLGTAGGFTYGILVLFVCLLAYLWFNATPSRLLMGDAGSRAMGIFLAITALMSKSPLLFIPLAIMLILDGGLGLLKVALLRFLKIHIFKNTTLPLHDYVRKHLGWSNTQVVFRFAIIQTGISLAVLYLVFIAVC